MTRSHNDPDPKMTRSNNDPDLKNAIFTASYHLSTALLDDPLDALHSEAMIPLVLLRRFHIPVFRGFFET